jgi:hypothetical protein
MPFSIHISILLMGAALLLFGPQVGADDLKINGSLDLYYLYNSNKPPLVTPPSDAHLQQPQSNNQYRVFDIYHDDINLAMAELVLQKSSGPFSVYLAFDFGHNAEVLSPDDEVTKNISQAVLTFKPEQAPRWSFTAGKMLTHMGLEVPKAKDNWNYSRSLLFGYAFPFWHVGLSARYEVIKDQLAVTAFLYNSTQGLYTTSKSKTVGTQISYSPVEKVTVIYNLLAGPESDLAGESHSRYVHELIGKYNLSPTLAVAADVVYGNLRHYYADGRSGNWFAWNANLRWSLGRFSLSPRYELYVDKSGASLVSSLNATAIPQRIDSQTLSASYDCGYGLELRGEVRRDHSTANVFLTASNRLVDTQMTSTVGVLYDF